MIGLDLPEKEMVYILTSYCASLRKEGKILVHYSDDLTGVGDSILKKLREGFYSVYTHIIKRLRDSKDEDTCHFLLNSLQCKIGASDHKYILDSGIIQLLKNGNEQKEKKNNPIKYSWSEEFYFPLSLDHQ